MKLKYLLFLAVSAIAVSCSKSDDEDEPVSETITFLSNKDLDGHIVNSTPRTVKNAESRLDIGWTGGASTRSFLTYDLVGITPPVQRVLKVEKVVLKVYEKNTNMLPFTGEGIQRVVEVYLLNYGTLDASDFDRATSENCGVITNTGYSVLKEYTLDVTGPVNRYLASGGSISRLQFRLQLTHNENVNTTTSTLGQAMWSLFSGEDQADLNDYRPRIDVTYKWEMPE
ncbi:MAG TPA: hypothetical protein VHO90_10930 [Bacteroidales bacterium]|nr:hypothetical protein [Bacteroidales bacterium]